MRQKNKTDKNECFKINVLDSSIDHNATFKIRLNNFFLICMVFTMININFTTSFLAFNGETVISSTTPLFLEFLKYFSVTSKEKLFRFLQSL